MEMSGWTSWRNLKTARTATGEASWKPMTRLPVMDAPGAVADTSDMGPSYTRTSSDTPPTALNRTIIGLKLSKKERSQIPFPCLAPKEHYDPVYPNYQRLQRWNNGMRDWKWENKEYLHPDDDWRLAHALMCQLDMTEYQKQRFHYLFWKLDRQLLGLATEKVVFGVCMLVCWEDGRRASPRYKEWDAEFARVADQQGYRKPLSWLEKVKRELKPWVKSKDSRRTPPKPPTMPPAPTAWSESGSTTSEGHFAA